MKHQSNEHHAKGNGKSSILREAANHFLDESKKLADVVYQEGLQKVNIEQEMLKEHVVDLAKKVKANPMSSILIAAGIGFLLSSIIKK